jgi:hypothetical protein
MTAVQEGFEGVSSDAAVAAAAGIGSNGSSVSFYSARSSLSECDSFGDDEDWSSAISGLSSLRSNSSSSDLASDVLAMVAAVQAGLEVISNDLVAAASAAASVAAAAAGIGCNGNGVSFYSARSSLSECDSFGADEDWSSAVSGLSSPRSNSNSSMYSAGSAVHSSNSNGSSGDSVGSALPRPTSSNSSRSSGSAKGFSMGAVIALCFACLLLGHVGVLQPMAELLSGVREGGWAGGYSVNAAIIQTGSGHSMDGFTWGARPWDAGQHHSNSGKLTMTLATSAWHNFTAAAAAHALAASAPSWRQSLLQDTTAVLQRLTAAATAQLRSWGVSVGLSRLSTRQYSSQYSFSHEVDAVADSLRAGVLQWQAAAQAACAAGDIWSVQQQLSNGRTVLELLGRGTCTCLRALQERAMQSATAAAADGVARNSSIAAAGQTARAAAQQTSCTPNNSWGDLLQQIAALPPSAASVSCAHNPNAGFEHMLQQIAAAGPTEAEVTCAYSSAAALTDMLRAFAAAEAAAGPQSRHDNSAGFERMLRQVSRAAAERAAWEAIPEVAAWLAQEAAAKAYANSPLGRVMTALSSLEVSQRMLFRSRVKSWTCCQDTCAIELVY